MTLGICLQQVSRLRMEDLAHPMALLSAQESADHIRPV
jgi:hypothetical protein